jgi:putative ABC transport system permease protein
LSGSGSSGTVTVDTNAVPADQINPEADLRIVTPGYMETLGMALVSGRYFDARDTASAAPVAIIDETMARTYWPDEDAIGKRIKRGGRQSSNPWQTIVGVVRHVRYQSLELPSRVQLYAPHAQAPSAGMSLALRARGDFANIAGAVQKATSAIDPDQPIFAVQAMDEFLAESVSRRRLVMMLLVVFAGVALVLAALGIYGVIAYWVSQRIHEIGIRLALGATRGSVLRMVVGQSLAIVMIGVALGLVGSLMLTRFITAMLFNVTPTDPPTFALVSLSLVGIGLLASLVPAVRATLVDPMQTLRQE